MNHLSFFEIQASDPEKLSSFYAAVFGWQFVKDPNLPIEYYRIQGAGAMGGLLKRPAETPPMEFGTNAFTCSMEVENFDKTAKLIIENGGIVAMEKFAVPGKCWQGYFVDIDHNVFGIFEVDEKAQ